MFKKSLVISLGVLLLNVGIVQASSSDLSVKISAPKSPTSSNSIKLSFVVLDLQNRSVSVNCEKWGPDDSSYSNYGSTLNLIAGGNSDECALNGSIMNKVGTYKFRVTAAAGVDVKSSNEVSVEYKTGGPSTPTNYSKEKIAECKYRINFKTADDSGKTVRVDIYRSDKSSFTADSSTRVKEIFVGSNQEKSYEDVTPDCSKEYFYVLRAFDNAGNMSSLVGDKTSVTVQSTVTTGAAEQGTNGAIVVNLKDDSQKAGSGEEGVANPSVTTVEVKDTPSVLGASTDRLKYLPWILVVLGLGVVGFLMYKKGDK